MPAHSELAFEAAIEDYLLTHGWAKGVAAEYNRALGLQTGPLFQFIGATQPDDWAKLVATYGDANLAQRKFAERLAQEITNRGTVDVLRRGVKDTGVLIRLAYFEPASDLTLELRGLFEANVLTVTRQVHHSESHPSDSIDMLLSVNGIPVATAELKNGIGQNVAVAVAQYRNDRDPKDLIFRARTLIHFAVDPSQVFMSTEVSSRFLPFNQGSNGPGEDGGRGNPANPAGHATAYLWEQVWQRNNWLDLLGSFVHAENILDDDGRKTGKKRLIFPRYHQWDAVTKLLADARDNGPGCNRLIQHSAGSGKSNTIAWLAHRLSRLHTAATAESIGAGAAATGLQPNMPVFDKVIVITDRLVLDRQLQDTIASFDHAPGMIQKIDEDSAQLRAALEGKKARIIITTLQKFPVISKAVDSLQGTRFAVIVDEAHTSQSGEAVKHLKKVLTKSSTLGEVADQEEERAADQDAQDLLVESATARGRQANLSFVAFTATPKQKTLNLFGQVGPGQSTYSPFHLYSMRQAIEEGFILDVLANYTTYRTYYRLANNLTDDDPEVPKGKAASALARWASLHPSMIEQRVEIIVEHFRAHTAKKIGGRAKAMVVTESRLHAVRYYEAIKKYCAEKGYNTGARPIRALVAFSGTVEDPDVPNVAYTEAMLNGFSEGRLPKQFAGAEYQVLVVAEKYQTGFDQPLLHTMYVIKKLKDIKAVQTLSRLNRVTAGKENTFVLDFINDGDAIQEAFAPYFTETTAVPSDPNMLYTLQQRILGAQIIDRDEMRSVAAAVLIDGRGGNAAVNAGIDPAYLRWTALDDDDPDKENFRTAVRDYNRGYAFMGQIMANPDPELEELYLYCKLLGPRLARATDPNMLDLEGSVSLSHLRTELRGDSKDLALTAGPVDPLSGASGSGQGKQHEEPLSPLSELIESLNAKFGTHLTEHDLILQTIHSRLESDDSVRAIAANNDRANFEASLAKPLMDAVLETQGVQGDFVDKLYSSAYMQKAVVREIAKLIWNNVRRGDVA